MIYRRHRHQSYALFADSGALGLPWMIAKTVEAVLAAEDNFRKISAPFAEHALPAHQAESFIYRN